MNAEIEEKKSVIRGKESVAAEKDNLTLTINKLIKEKQILEASIDNLNNDKANKDKRIEELGKQLEEMRSQVCSLHRLTLPMGLAHSYNTWYASW